MLHGATNHLHLNTIETEEGLNGRQAVQDSTGATDYKQRLSYLLHISIPQLELGGQGLLTSLESRVVHLSLWHQVVVVKGLR